MGKDSRLRRARRAKDRPTVVVHVCVRCRADVVVAGADDLEGYPVVCAGCFVKTTDARDQLDRMRAAAVAQLREGLGFGDHEPELPDGQVFSVRYAEVVSADHLRAHVSLTPADELPPGALVWPLVQ